MIEKKVEKLTSSSSSEPKTLATFWLTFLTMATAGRPFLLGAKFPVGSLATTTTSLVEL
jgi:hypothetical protein